MSDKRWLLVVRSFGQPAEESGEDEELEALPQQPGPSSRVALAVDLVLTDESLEGVEAQLTALVTRAVLAGFAAAALETQN